MIAWTTPRRFHLKTRNVKASVFSCPLRSSAQIKYQSCLNRPAILRYRFNTCLNYKRFVLAQCEFAPQLILRVESWRICCLIEQDCYYLLLYNSVEFISMCKQAHAWFSAGNECSASWIYEVTELLNWQTAPRNFNRCNKLWGNAIYKTRSIHQWQQIKRDSPVLKTNGFISRLS